MSLFKSIEWWRAGGREEEDCDAGCLCVANVDNAEDGGNKIITGNFNGVLRIYSPNEGGDSTPHDILLEKTLAGPILQVATGKFLSVSQDVHLAVLLPRSLTVYSITVKKGAVDHGNECIMNKIYEHKLERTAANMTYGSFGGVKDKDFLCVQSMDGTLSIFESENFIFMRFIPGFLMPGPLAYCAKIDSFLTVSSNRCLECYSYQVLAVAASSKTKEESQNITSGKRIKADWQLNLGECALDIKVVDTSDGTSVIMVLGERNLFCVQDSGRLKYMKKLEYNPACFYPYPSADSQAVNCIVCSHSKQLLVYEGITMKWATVLEEVPVQVAIGYISDVDGMITTLTGSCKVSCLYLGTHPSIFSLPQSATRDLDSLSIEKEISKVNEKIRQLHNSKGDFLSNDKTADDLKIKINVPPTIDRVSVAGHQAPISSEGPVPSITCQIILKASRRVTNVSIMIHVDEPLISTQKHITIPSIDVHTPAESDPTPCATVSFFLGHEFSPASLSFEAVVHYQQSGTGNPRVVTTTAELPLSLVSWPSDPVKSMEEKVTLESSTPCMNLLELFPELGSADAGPHCVGLKLIHGPRTTILASKSSNRYRVQSNTYAGLWLMTRELLRRIQQLSSSCKITHAQPVGLDELSPIIDRHFELRLSKVNVYQLLDQRAKQFRAIQRRLLTRFKDKTPAPLNCLDTLLEGTYRQILALADASEENASVLIMSSVELSCVLRLIILLSKLSLGLADKETDLLECVLCVSMKDAEMGWEETVESSVSALLKTVLSRGGKDLSGQNMSFNASPLELPSNVAKLKKMISTLFDRLSKGGRLIPPELSHSSPGSGPISNISNKFGPLKKGKPVVSGAFGDDKALVEEDEDALIADIMSSAPMPPTVLKAPYGREKPPVKNDEIVSQNSNSVHVVANKNIPTSATMEPLMSNLSLNGRLDDSKNDFKAQEELYSSISKPVEIVMEPRKEEVYGASDDIMESSSFFDDVSDDTYAM